ncbi:hypothetical protein RT99_13525 [Flavobacterium sp. MEB061]|uniref:hypothetical protein n=1 Tax=Flavobacterium sp. MEB061 TaxID=1587524 RepID=UPI0005ACA4EB|nr:hypothetical protein [Flavobacterium sp. MEB061]KIQ20112.1 hypothetical protein RT99_13525 [Flavobacterium sp. MEB061]
MITRIRLIIPGLLLVTVVQAQSVVQSNDTRISLDSIDINVESKESSLVDKNAVKTEMSKVFYENAKRAGLSQEKTNELLKIMQERNESLKYLDIWKEQYDDSYTLEDRGTLYNFKANAYRNLYAKKINNLLTYQEYCYFIVDEYREVANENSKLEYQQLLKSNPSLSKEQKIELYDLIYNYHLNERLTKIYLSFDRTLQNPRLGVLRVNFEKDFAKMCKKFNIKTTDPKETKNNNFKRN